MSQHGNYHIKRQFLQGGFAAQYALERELSPGQISELLQICLDTLLRDVLNREELLGLKGREPTVQLIADALSSPSSHEVLFVKGILPVQVVDDAQAEECPFEVRVHTPFKEFVSSGHIRHSVECKRRSLPAFIRTRRLGAVFPLKLSSFRIGLELFKAKSFGSMLGLAPTVYQGLYIDCVVDRFALRIFSDALKRRDELPLSSTVYLEKLAYCLKEVFGIDLLSELTC